MSSRFVIVGSGIAALSAAEAIRELEPHAHILLVSREAHPFYSRPGLAYFLTGDVPERQLAVRTGAQLRELQLERVTGEVVSIDPAAHSLRLADGRSIGYDRLLLATGAQSIAPSFPGADAAGVLRLDGLDDARQFVALVRSARTAVVIGGGSTALELVEACAARGVRTHYLLRGERYWPRVLDAAESAIVEARLGREGVQLHHAASIARVVAPDGRVRAVETDAGERIPCDLVAVAIGVRPRIELARAAGITTDQGILADDRLATSDPDVFVAGDAAQARDPATGEALLDTLWSSAAAQGRVAGRNAAGATDAYRRSVAMNVTRLAGITTTIVGEVGGAPDADLLTITRGQSERWRAPGNAWTLSRARGEDRLRVLIGEDRIVGAVLMGDQSLSRPLARMIAAGADISSIRAQLEANPAAAVPLLETFFRRWEATCPAA